MSGVFTRLHRIFASTQKTTKNPITNIKPKTPIPTNLQTPTIKPHKFSKQKKPTAGKLITDLLEEKDTEKLLQNFKSLSESNFFRRQYKVYEQVIYRLKLANQFSFIQEALEHQLKYLNESEGFAIRIIYLYGKAGMFDHAQKMFDEMPERKCERGAKSLSALLGAAVNSQKFDKAYELFRELPSKLSIEVNVDCYSTVANALCKLGLLDEAVSLLDEMEANGLKPNVVCYNTLMGAFYGKGDIVGGGKIWERLINNDVEPDLGSYGYKTQGLVSVGKLSEAIELVEGLKSKGLKPNLLMYNALIQGCIKDDDLDGAKKWYGDLLKNSYLPNKTTFDTFAPFLCEKGDYGFAFKVCQTKFKWVCSVDEATLQNVVDGLVKSSMIEEAKTLVELGKSNRFLSYNLVMPSTE